MGVLHLWPILEETCDPHPLSHLRGKRVAVDLGIWVMQGQKCHGLNKGRKPHLKNLFYKLGHLLRYNVFPIFILEGEPPDVKANTIKKRLKRNSEDDATSSRSNFDRTLKECEEFLKSCGAPCLKSSGEAEAFCAFLNEKGIVDGCITDDSDAFLYGAQTVYKDFGTTSETTGDEQKTNFNEYSIGRIENVLGLNREKLVALALLLGCDYDAGLSKVGTETAMKLLQEIKCTSVLERFKEWKRLSEVELFPQFCDKSFEKRPSHCTRCGHPGEKKMHNKQGCIQCNSKITCYLMNKQNTCSCDWHRNLEAKNASKVEFKVYNCAKDKDDFPNIEVINEYLNFSDAIPLDKDLTWITPDVQLIEEQLYSHFNWTVENITSKSFPLITSWQIAALCRRDNNDANKDLLYEPLRIIKVRKKYDEKFYKVLWKKIGNEILVDNAAADDTVKEAMCTQEDIVSFAKAYPQVESAFLDAEESKKCVVKKPKRATKTKKRTPLSSPSPHSDANSSKKIMDFFTPLPRGSSNEVEMATNLVTEQSANCEKGH